MLPVKQKENKTDNPIEKTSLLGKKDNKSSTIDINDNVDSSQQKTRFSQALAYDTFNQHVYNMNKQQQKEKISDTFLRKTTKFWVLPHNFLAMKKRISKVIPEWRFDRKTSPSLKESGSWIHSVYFDTSNLDLYDKRIQQIENSMLFRYRWYSNALHEGFMEQKIRGSQWKGEASIKRRFQLSDDLVLGYINNGPTNVPLKKEIVNEMYNDMQNYPAKLRHMIRSTYRRTVFQHENGGPVRISFDEDVTLVNLRELTWDKCVNTSYANSPHNVFHFPLGILEVKLSFENVEEIEELKLPEWVVNMQNAGLIIQVEKFSKYCTGAAIMNLHTIKRVPSWIAAVKTLMEIELARTGQEWFSSEKNANWEVIKEKTFKVPERVEPREYLSNERTLLKWVRMCFLALFVGLALLGFEHEPVTGIILTICSLIILARAFYMYHVRLRMLEKHNYTINFHDPWGPQLIIVLFVVPAISYLLYCFGVFKVKQI